MRQFSKREKETIKFILDGVAKSATYLPINAYNDIFYREKVEFDAQSNDMELVFYTPENADLPDSKRMLDVYYEILEVSLLIDYLKKEGLVYQISMPSTNKLRCVGGFDKNGLNNKIALPVDPKVGQILLDCMNSPIFVSQTLKDLVANDFLSLEGQSLLEAKKQTKISFITLFLSVIAIIVSLIPTCKSNTKDKDDPCKSLIEEIDSSRVKIDHKLDVMIDVTQKINTQLQDTLNVNLIRKYALRNSNKKIISDPCIQTIKLDTCRDTIVPKKNLVRYSKD